MVVTNKTYDTGFPFRIIAASKYMKSMRLACGQDYWKLLAKMSKKFEIIKEYGCEIEPPIQRHISLLIGDQLKNSHLLNHEAEKAPTEEKRLTKKSLEYLEVWWLRYELTKCCSEDPIDIDRVLRIIDEEALEDYAPDENLNGIIQREVDKLRFH
jgi:hypothetical protein